MMSEIETIVRLYVSNSSFITYAWLVVELWLGNFVSQPKIMIVDYMSDYNTNEYTKKKYLFTHTHNTHKNNR